MRDLFPPRRREKEKVKSQSLSLGKDPALPFICQGEQVT
jgi:hypothetical protein